MTTRIHKPKYRYCTPATHVPTETEIRAACLSIQAGWTPEDEMRRRGLLQTDGQVGVDRPGKLASTPPVSTAGLPGPVRDLIDAATWWK